jgi:hypothetical protein
MENPQRMTIISPDNVSYCGYYIDRRVEINSIPKEWHRYDIRHDDDCCGIFCCLENNDIWVNNAGSFVTKQHIKELEKEDSFINFKIDPEEWRMTHEDPDNPDKEIEDPPENYIDDWDWTFGGGKSPIIIIDEDKFYGRRK